MTLPFARPSPAHSIAGGPIRPALVSKRGFPGRRVATQMTAGASFSHLVHTVRSYGTSVAASLDLVHGPVNATIKAYCNYPVSLLTSTLFLRTNLSDRSGPEIRARRQRRGIPPASALPWSVTHLRHLGTWTKQTRPVGHGRRSDVESARGGVGLRLRERVERFCCHFTVSCWRVMLV